jgi:putative hydrolase of the HAD superfamily
MIRGVVLDVDDTLYLERDYVRSGFEAVGAWCRDEWGVEDVAERAWQLFLGGRRRTTLTDALAACGKHPTDAELQVVIDVYRSHGPRIIVSDDARQFLLTHVGQVRLGVLTDGPAVSQRAKCAALGLYEIADPVVVTADLGTAKPDPSVYRLFEDQWSLSGPELVYVADNPAKDFLAPVERGWRSVRVRRDGSLHVEVDTPEGVTEVADLAELQF